VRKPLKIASRPAKKWKEVIGVRGKGKGRGGEGKRVVLWVGRRGEEARVWWSPTRT